MALLQPRLFLGMGIAFGVLFAVAPRVSGGWQLVIVGIVLWRATEILVWYTKLLFDEAHRVFLEVERNLLFLIGDSLVFVTALAVTKTRLSPMRKRRLRSTSRKTRCASSKRSFVYQTKISVARQRTIPTITSCQPPDTRGATAKSTPNAILIPRNRRG